MKKVLVPLQLMQIIWTDYIEAMSTIKNFHFI
jgi:hypothetical protein